MVKWFLHAESPSKCFKLSPDKIVVLDSILVNKTLATASEEVLGFVKCLAMSRIIWLWKFIIDERKLRANCFDDRREVVFWYWCDRLGPRRSDSRIGGCDDPTRRLSA